MKKARMNISHFRFILFNLKIFSEIVTTRGVETWGDGWIYPPNNLAVSPPII